MLRLLQIALIVVLLVVAWRLLRRWLLPPPPAESDSPKEFQPMGRCSKCGTHVPRAELEGTETCNRCRGAA